MKIVAHRVMEPNSMVQEEDQLLESSAQSELLSTQQHSVKEKGK